MKSTLSSTSWRTPGSLVLALLALGAAGCVLFAANVPITPQTGKPVPASRIYRPELTQPSLGNTAKVMFLRDAGGYGGGCSHQVLVDDDKIFTIRAGEFQAVYLAPGKHKFIVEIEGGICQAFSRSHFTVLSDGAEETHRIIFRAPPVGFGVQQLISTSGSIGIDNTFRTTHYEWVAPSEAGWTLGEWEEPFALTNSISPTTEFRIVVLEKPITGERLGGQTARFVADDYRRFEEEDMVENGVKTGQYGATSSGAKSRLGARRSGR